MYACSTAYGSLSCWYYNQYIYVSFRIDILDKDHRMINYISIRNINYRNLFLLGYFHLAVAANIQSNLLLRCWKQQAHSNIMRVNNLIRI